MAGKTKSKYVIKNMIDVVIRTFTSELDDYGQSHTLYSDEESKMFMKRHSYMPDVSDPRFINVELIGLTEDSINTTQNVFVDFPEGGISYDSEGNPTMPEYKVVYVIESPRFNQVFMERI